MAVKSISLMGSTGSIGVNTIKVCEDLGIRVKAIACRSNSDMIIKQILDLKPERAGVVDEEAGSRVWNAVRSTSKTELFIGPNAVMKACVKDDVDTVVNALVGVSGLLPTIETLRRGIDVRLANKETLVVGGEVVMEVAKKNGAKVIPIDSEHSAIFQALAGNDIKKVKKVVITMSGGALREMGLSQLENATPEDALKHPNWNMGNKITIDCATGMNKAFECIEAKWLFGLKPSQIEVLIHPQSKVHALVYYCDGNTMSHLSLPDMRHAIQYSLTYPERRENSLPLINLNDTVLEFRPADTTRYKALKLGYYAMDYGGTLPAVMNGANDYLVGQFLEHRIRFTDISDVTEKVMEIHTPGAALLRSLLEANKWAAAKASEIVSLRREQVMSV